LKTEVEEKTKTLQDAIKENDLTKMRESQTALQDALNRAGQAVYTAAQAEAGADAQAPDADATPDADGKPGGSRPGTVEGEFREV
jgi:molecular chaperone DnaK